MEFIDLEEHFAYKESGLVENVKQFKGRIIKSASATECGKYYDIKFECGNGMRIDAFQNGKEPAVSVTFYEGV